MPGLSTICGEGGIFNFDLLSADINTPDRLGTLLKFDVAAQKRSILNFNAHLCQITVGGIYLQMV